MTFIESVEVILQFLWGILLLRTLTFGWPFFRSSTIVFYSSLDPSDALHMFILQWKIHSLILHTWTYVSIPIVLQYFVIIKTLEELYEPFLCHHDMQDCKSISTLMASALSIDKDEFSIDVDNKRYRGMIGFFLYSTANIPNIMFSVCMCVRYQASPQRISFKNG
jgi:hypothetical protein